MATIKGHSLDLVKTNALIDNNTIYGFDIIVSQTQATIEGVLYELQNILAFKVLGFFPNYSASSSQVQCICCYEKRKINTVTAEKEVTEVNAQNFSYTVNNNIQVNSPFGVVGQFQLFQYISEIGQLRLPENLINGLLNKSTSFQQIASQQNPIYVSREYVSEYYPIEVYNSSYEVYQNFIAQVKSVVPALNEQLGNIELEYWEHAGQVQCQINGGGYVNANLPQGHIFSDLAEGEYLVNIKDDTQIVSYNITV